VSDTVLGRGQFGVVVFGEWMGNPVVLKTLENYDADKNEELFRKELEIMQGLHHPSIVQFLGYTQERNAGTPLQIIMEFLPCGSLEDYVVAKGSSIPLGQRVRWCGQMAQALAYLHNRQPAFLVHRDVKPSNFMLTKSLDVKLGDFGISKLFDKDGVIAQPPPPTPTLPDQSPVPVPKTSAAKIRHTAASRTQPSPIAVPSRKLAAKRVNNSVSMLNPKTDKVKYRPVYESQLSMELTNDVGTTMYMAPEVHLAKSESGGNGGITPKAVYSVQADVFSVGMVYLFVFEQGRAPCLPGAGNTEEHFAALAAGVRPTYFLTKAAQRHVVDLCLRERPTERPTSRELVALFKGMASSPPSLSPFAPLWKLLLGRGGGDKEKTRKANSATATAREVMEEVKKREGVVGSSSDLTRQSARNSHAADGRTGDAQAAELNPEEGGREPIGFFELKSEKTKERKTEEHTNLLALCSEL